MIRFYLDENLSPRIAVIARGHGLDVSTAHELGRTGLPDDEQLRLAAADARCLVTRDRDDFLTLTVDFFTNGWPHAGVLIIPRSLAQDDFRGMARALAAFARDHADGLPPYTTAYLRPVRE